MYHFAPDTPYHGKLLYTGNRHINAQKTCKQHAENIALQHINVMEFTYTTTHEHA